MSRTHRSLSPDQLERRRAAQARKQLWQRIQVTLFMAVLLGIVAFSIYTQIAHHR